MISEWFKSLNMKRGVVYQVKMLQDSTVYFEDEIDIDVKKGTILFIIVNQYDDIYVIDSIGYNKGDEPDGSIMYIDSETKDLFEIISKINYR